MLNNSHKKSFIYHLTERNETWLFLILISLVTVISLISPRFFTARNAFQILRSSAFTGILSVGFLLVLISGGLDISFTATATVAQYLMAVLLAANPDVPSVVVVLLPLVLGTLLGALNAVLIHVLNAPSIIIAIANLNVYYGILQLFSQGRWIYDFPAWFVDLGRSFLVRFVDANGVPFGLSVLTAIWFLIALLGYGILRHMKLGRRLYAMGGDLEAARRAGLNIFRLRLFAYSFLGFSAGLAGFAHALNTQTVAPNALVGQEFNVVAAVVLGGANIFGGAGTIGGITIGVLLISVITNALTILKVPAFWHQVFIGTVVLASISVTALRSYLARKRGGSINVR